MDQINKLTFPNITLPATILIASLILGGFYYASQVNKQRSIERQQQIKIEQQRQAKEEAEQALNACLADAEEAYSNLWDKECKALGKLTSKCIDINELSYNEYLKKYGLTEEEYKKQRGITDDSPLAGLFDYLKRRSDECSCRLPTHTADDFGNYRDKLKAECFKRYPQK